MSRVVIAMTGPTGTVYWLRALELLLNTETEVHVVLPEASRRGISQEMGLELPADPIGQKAALLRYWIDRAPRRAVPERVKRRFFCHDPGDAEAAVMGATANEAPGASGKHGAPGASGPAEAPSVLIIPCPMPTIAAIAAGFGGDLVEKAAGTALRVARPLVVVPQDAPLGRIDLRNLLTLSEAGARVHPACPVFGAQPKDLLELVDSVVVAALKPLLGDEAAEAAAAARAQ
ncbi:MAG: flavoprotein [Bacillota bacterium]